MSTNKNYKHIDKDSPGRSILKAISWRLVASGATFIISYVIFRQFTEKSNAEVIETATLITSIEMVAKLILYYLHEMVVTHQTQIQSNPWLDSDLENLLPTHHSYPLAP